MLAGRDRLIIWVLGSDQERALRRAADAAVRRTSQEFSPGDAATTPHWARQAWGMADQPVDLEAVFARVLESGRGSEMAVRLRQSLEITDGLWELVPVVVAASQAHERRSPAQVADSSGVAKVLTAEPCPSDQRGGGAVPASAGAGAVEARGSRAVTGQGGSGHGPAAGQGRGHGRRRRGRWRPYGC